MLDSDISNADSQLHVEFYISEEKEYKGQPFVRITVPGDKTNVVDQPVRDDHKQRFPRQWLYFSMQGAEDNAASIGTPLTVWHEDSPETFGKAQLMELQIMKFQTVEQLATASDAQLQRIGMGAAGLREQARQYILSRTKVSNNAEFEQTKRELAQLKEQMAQFMAARKPGRPPKQIED
jgi:hypothetical protein